MLNENAMYRVISVHDLSWDKAVEAVAGRKFNALSFRIVGNTVITSDKLRLSASTGDVLCIPKGVSYTVDHGREHIIAIHFDSDMNEKEPWVLDLAGKTILRDLFCRADLVWSGKKTGYRFELDSIFCEILRQISIQNSKLLLSGTSESFRKTVDYIQSHFCDQSFSVASLCASSGMSDTYFRRLFKRQFGTSPVKFITALRISHAKELLQSGYYSVSQVSEMCGFHDAKYFSTVFHGIEKLTPSDFMSKK